MDRSAFDEARAADCSSSRSFEDGLADDFSCVEKKTGGMDCPSSIRIGAVVSGRGGRGRSGRGPAPGRGTTIPSRFEHHHDTASASGRAEDGGSRMIRDGFCPGEYLIGGVKYTQLCAIAPNFANQIIRIRFNNLRDIVVNSQNRFMLVFFNEQGDSLVRCVDTVHGLSRGAPSHTRGSSVRGRAPVADAKPVVPRRTGSVIRTASAFDD